MTSIAVVGAGLSGLLVARALSDNHDVRVFEKSRAVGGRMATRVVGDFQFDYGTQFFTAKTDEFRAFLQLPIDLGHVAPWNAEFAQMERSKIVATGVWTDKLPHYVGVPDMTALCKWLATQLNVRLQVSVAGLEQRDGRWLLSDDTGAELGRFDWVVVTAPAAQTTALLPEACSIRKHSEAAEMLACYSLMLADRQPLSLPWQAALVGDADITWVGIDSSKPGRGEAFCVLVQSTNDWAQAHVDDDPDRVKSHLLDESSVVLGVDARSAAYSSLHRWRYANIDLHGTPGFAIDTQLQLAACGDWFIRGRVEAAFDSATGLSAALQKLI